MVVRPRAENFMCRNGSLGVQSYTAGWIGSTWPPNVTQLPHATCFNLRHPSCVKFLRSVGRGTHTGLWFGLNLAHTEKGGSYPTTHPRSPNQPPLNLRFTQREELLDYHLPPLPSPHRLISRVGWLKLAESGAAPASCALP